MATDSTELTFVRCPSCRSLVPAVSTRCRMCGTTLDSSAATDESGEGQKRSGRVRQKTMSAPASELSEGVDRIRDELVVQAPAEEPKPAPKVAPIVTPVVEAPRRDPKPEAVVIAAPVEDVDPLRSYLEEDEAEAVTPSVAASTPVEPSPTSPESKREEILLKEVVETTQIEAKRAAPQVNGSAVNSEAQRSDAKPRVIVETGSRKGGKGSSLSFGSRREDQPARQMEAPREAQQTKPEVRQEVRRDSRPATPQVERPQVAPQGERPKQNQEEQRGWGNKPAQEQPRREAREGKEPPRPERRWEPEAPRESRKAPQESRAPLKKHEGAPGRLFGWLVNYTTPDGNSVELREGKFFVTASSLKATDLIIPDESVSTPHALVIVGVESGLVVQDLMSERGVFVRERDDSAYRRDYDPTQLKHGDWVRFGDVEFLVSLIPHVGVK